VTALSTAASLDALREFAQTGFFVHEGAIAEAACDALLAALSEVIARTAAERLAGARAGKGFWELLAGSAHGVEVFFDEGPGPLHELPAPAWEARAMRIGHGLHLAEAAFAAFARLPQIAGPLRRFAHAAALLSGGTSAEEAAAAAHEAPAPARLVQSAVIYKQPRSDVVQFGFHRDAAYLPTEPESLVLAFVALDRTTAENGCLEVIPRTHTEPLWMRLRLGPQGFVEVGREPRPDAARRVLLPLSRGSIAFVHGRAMHASAPNRSDGPRRALIVHAMSELSELSRDAWVKAPPEGFARI
jgi:phytanoyl-CoA hydroxylase